MATAKPLKIGRKVNITLKNSKATSGKIHGIRETDRGTWYDVNVGDKRNPLISSYRAGNLQAA